MTAGAKTCHSRDSDFTPLRPIIGVMLSSMTRAGVEQYRGKCPMGTRKRGHLGTFGDIRPALVSALVAVGLCAVTLRGTYIYDDVEIVRTDPRVLDPAKWGRLWTQPYFVDAADRLYRPLVSMSFAVENYLHGDRPWVFHLVNVLCFTRGFRRRWRCWGCGWADGWPVGLRGFCLRCIPCTWRRSPGWSGGRNRRARWRCWAGFCCSWGRGDSARAAPSGSGFVLWRPC